MSTWYHDNIKENNLQT